MSSSGLTFQALDHSQVGGVVGWNDSQIEQLTKDSITPMRSRLRRQNILQRVAEVYAPTLQSCSSCVIFHSEHEGIGLGDSIHRA